MPKPSQLFTENHCVCSIGYNDKMQLLRFINCWGPNWGYKGSGSLPYDYFARFSQDAWYFQLPFFKNPITKEIKKRIPTRFFYRDMLIPNSLGYASVMHDLWDSADNTRVGWCIATERDNHLDVEEFFVCPGYRGTGHGRKLMSSLINDSNGSGLPLRFWISHADWNTPSRCILPMNHLLTKNGYIARASGVSWAQYVAEKPTARGRKANCCKFATVTIGHGPTKWITRA